MMHHSDPSSKNSELSTKITQLLGQLLGHGADHQLLNQLAHDQKIFNALCDLSETIYERYAPQLIVNPDMHQSLWMQILQHGRVRFTLHDPAIDFPPTAMSQLAHQTFDLSVTAHQQADLKNAEHDNQKDIDLSDSDCVAIDYDQQCSIDTLSNQLTAVTDPLPTDTTTINDASADPDNEVSGAERLNELPLTTAASVTPNTTATPSPVIKKMPHFQIPNARVDVPYQAQIRVQGAADKAIEIQADSVKFSSAVGIDFDAQTGQFVGTPTVAGEYQIHFMYQEQKGWRSGQCTFIINADPRSLWQVNEPSADEPYHKAHTAQQIIRNDAFQIIAASRRGRSHEHAGTFRDDDFFIGQVADSPWSVLVVADGAGSAQFSRQGSKIAVDCAGQLLTDYIQQNQETLDAHLVQWQTASDDDNSKTAAQSAVYNDFHDIFYKVAQTSIQQIETEAQAQNVPTKTFATTLLAAVVKQQDHQTFMSTFWIGDGAIVVYSADKLRLMGTPDSGEFAGQTRFLDKSIVSNFGDRVNIGYFDDIAAVILMTDGISDPRFETDAGLKNQQKWDALWQELQNPLAEEQPENALLEWMHFFSAGHHDDRTLALLLPHASVQNQQTMPVATQAVDHAVDAKPEAEPESTQGLNDE